MTPPSPRSTLSPYTTLFRSFYDEKGSPKDLRYSLLNRAATALSDAFDRVAIEEIKIASDQYVRIVLLWSNERIEVVRSRSEEHTSELQSRLHLVWRLLLEKK